MQSLRSLALKPLAAAALFALAGAAHASFITYDSSASFASATTGHLVKTDNFSNLASGNLGTSIVRNAEGFFSYVVTDTASQLYGIGGALSTATNGDSITFKNLPTQLFAIGANFYNTLKSGAFASSQALTLTIVDANGSHDFLYSNITAPTDFFGIVSTVAITSLTVTGLTGAAYATVDNLTLASPVPEPETYALMLGGLGVVSWLRRRSARAA